MNGSLVVQDFFKVNPCEDAWFKTFEIHNRYGVAGAIDMRISIPALVLIMGADVEM